jgi:hypothetical protein
MSDPSMDLLRLINGYWVSQAISVAASLRIADLLKDGPRTSEDLATATRTHQRSLYRLLRALAAARVFEEHADGRFSLAVMGEFLRSDLPNSRRAWAELIGRPYVRESWGALAHTVRTGDTAFRHLYGCGIWEWRSGKPDERAIFDTAMSGMSRMAAHAVVDAYDFSPLACVVDVGGGQGALLSEILSRHSRLNGILFDLPGVIEGARPVLEAAGVAGRCQAIAGDVFTAVPEGGDAYIVKSVLMDEDDENAVRLLETCRKAMKRSARLLVIERLLGEANEAPEAKFSDLTMMLITGGRERVASEFEKLFSTAGFRLERVIRTRSPFSIIVGDPS